MYFLRSSAHTFPCDIGIRNQHVGSVLHFCHQNISDVVVPKPYNQMDPETVSCIKLLAS